MTMDEYMNALLSDEVMNEERGMFKKAREYGREEGMCQGISIGESRGMDMEKKSVAKRLLKETDNLEFISRISGLDEEEIRKLQEN